jgi:hypothetical protein
MISTGNSKEFFWSSKSNEIKLQEEDYSVDLILELYENDDSPLSIDKLISNEISEETKKLLLRSLFVKASFESSNKHLENQNVSRIAEISEVSQIGGMFSYFNAHQGR